MKKKVSYLLLILTLLCMTFFSNIDAATMSANNVTVGQSINISVNLGTSVGAYSSASLTCNGNVIKSEGLWNFDSNTINGISSKSYTYTPKSAGTYKFVFTMTGAADFKTDSLVNGNGTITVSKTVTVNPKQSSNNNSNKNSSSKPTTTDKNNTTSSTSTKSSNNYLKTLQVSEEGLTPDFVKTKTNYTLSVGEKVEKLNVTAIAEDSKAKVTVSGNNELKNGDNKIVVDVVAENGAKRTYTITVNKSGDAVKSNSYLSNLIIRDMTLTPEFSSEVLEYDGGVIKTNDTKLDIYAYPTNENAKVEILGNENLVLGENTVTIKITSEDETTTKEYVIKFVREEGEVVAALANTEEDNSTPKDEVKNFFKDIWKTIKANALILLMYLLIIVEYVQIVYLYKKLKEKNAKDKDDNNDKKSFDQFNIKLEEDKKSDLKLIEDNIEEDIKEKEYNNSLEEIEDEKIEDTVDNIEETVSDINKEDEEQEEIEKKVKSIWDEERPNFLEDEEEINEDNTKRRRGRK